MDTRTDNLIFECDDRLLIAIIDQVYKLKRFCYVCDLVLLIFSGYMYNEFGKDVPFFVICQLVAIAGLGLFQYMLLSPKSKVITKIVIEVRLTPIDVVIRTAAFDGPLWFKKRSGEFLLRRSELMMTMVSNPYSRMFKTEEQILLIRYRNQDLYVIPGYFKPQLLAELLQVI